MNLTERNRQLALLGQVTERFCACYRRERLGEHELFLSEHGDFFRVCAFPGEFALVIEYAAGREDAAAGRWEDGDRFYLDDYAGLDGLVEAMRAEIASAGP